MITYFRKCPGCNNAVGGETVYQCTECRKWYCDKCKDIGKHSSGSRLEGRCPRCGAGETNDAYECGTVDLNKPFCTHEWGQWPAVLHQLRLQTMLSRCPRLEINPYSQN
jgi:hypothetical protein